jgi:hypothetical protein
LRKGLTKFFKKKLLSKWLMILKTPKNTMFFSRSFQ